MRKYIKTQLLLISILFFSTAQPGWSKVAVLKSIRTGEHENFTRIVFEFEHTVQFKHPEIMDKGKFSVQFLPCSTDLPPVTTYETGSLQKVNFIELAGNESHLTAAVTLTFPEFTLKAFSLPDPDCIIVDAYPVSALSKDSESDTALEHGVSSEISKSMEKKDISALETPLQKETQNLSVEPLNVSKASQKNLKPFPEEAPLTDNIPNQAQTQKISPGPNYVIGTGDVLFISVWKDEALTNQVVVLPDGMITFPLVGEIQASGKTVAALKAEFEEKIAHYLPDPTLTVMVQQVNSMKIYIIGRVNRPGSYPLGTHFNVLQALSMAGGLNPFADRKKIKIFRNRGEQETIFRFNYDAVTQGEKPDQNIALKRGDTIVVP
jgi:polysaccharide biosynthesis/export protein